MEQAASDLEKNHQRQQELAEELRVLKQEEALLAEILSLAERYEGFSDPSRLPEQMQGEPLVAKQRPASRTASRRPAPTGSAPAARAAKGGTKGKAQQPLLGDLLADLLGHHDEPCLAKDLREELLEKYPRRNPTPQVVRNTLEALVAKGRIERHKQQRSVLYTLVRPGAVASGEAG
ncbi:hypothetical protein [Kitasatospora sp. HPMI-4]|uniref:hypothetical protein n=1 Tax=Kitasatospora sp. HPMI-4 TaxID=3448443 RepID=UPI003F1C533D